MFKSEAGIKMVLVTTDDEVYSTLQLPLNSFLEKHNLPGFIFDVEQIRDSLPRPWDIANCLMELKETGDLPTIATTWLNFERGTNQDGTPYDVPQKSDSKIA
jgi:hypothetical protein